MWLYVTLTSVLTSDHDNDVQDKEGEEEEGEETKAPSDDIHAKENIGNTELRPATGMKWEQKCQSLKIYDL